MSKTFRKILRSNHERNTAQNSNQDQHQNITSERKLRKIRKQEQKDKMIESKFIKRSIFKLRYDGKIFKEDNVEIGEDVEAPDLMTPMELIKKHIKEDAININREYVNSRQPPDQFQDIDFDF